MIAKQEIIKVAELKIKELDGFLVDVKVNTANVITVFFDRTEGVQIEHCLEISKYVEAHFDREVEDYELTVSSPGLSKPFVVNEQYQKNIGKEIIVKLSDGKKVKGKLIAFDGDIILETNKKEKDKKQIKKETKIILSEQVKETKLVIKF